MQKLHQDLVSKHRWYKEWHQNKSHSSVHHFLFIIAAVLVTVGLLSNISKNDLASGTVLAKTTKSSSNTNSSKSKYDTKELLNLTNDLLSTANQYKNATSDKKSALLDNLLSVATARKQAMLSLLSNKPSSDNPKIFKTYALPASISKNLPSEISSLVEAPATIEGKYTVYHQDDFKNPANQIWEYRVKDSKSNTYQLHSTTDSYTAKQNSTVKVTGTVLDNQILLADSATAISTVAATTIAYSSVGEQKMAVINFLPTESTITGFTNAQLQKVYFADPATDPRSLNSYIKETSFGQTWVTGTVFGPYSITGAVDCSTQITMLNQQISEAGIDLANYPRIAYVSPYNYCGNQASPNGWMSVNPASPTIDPSLNSLYTYSYHEFGHVLGINHADSMYCGAKQIDRIENCPIYVEYGDYYDSMGKGKSGQAFFQYNAPHKMMLSWIPQSRVQQITTDGTYTVFASERVKTGPQLLTIYKPDISTFSKGYLTIDFREQFGVDLTLPPNVTSGVTIHTYQTGNTRSVLFDATPGDNTELHNKAVLDGMSFVDDVLGITITQLSHTSDLATVKVTFNPTTCSRGQALIDSSSVGLSYITAGETKAISFNVANGDDARCGPSTFIFGADVPVGWNVVPATVSINPLATGTGTIYITSPASAPSGATPIKYRVSDGSEQKHSATYDGQVIITAPTVDTQPPTTSITSPVSGNTVTGTTTISANATDNVGVTKVEFWLGNSTVIGTDTTGPSPYTISWNTTTVANGTYSLTTKAYDAAGLVGISTPITISVQNIISNTPLVNITSPLNGAIVGSTVTINANASSQVGISKIEIYVDNVLKVSTRKAGTTSLSYSWSTRKVAPGSHTITAKAYDTGGGVGQASVTVIK